MNGEAGFNLIIEFSKKSQTTIIPTLFILWKFNSIKLQGTSRTEHFDVLVDQ